MERTEVQGRGDSCLALLDKGDRRSRPRAGREATQLQLSACDELLHAKQHKRERASVAKIRTGIRMLEEGLSGSKSELFSGNDQAKLQGHLASALRNLG